MELFNDYGNFQIYGFWSKEVSTLVDKINSYHGKSYATQHDMVLKFVNDAIFQGKGEFNKEFRKKGKTYPDLKISGKKIEKGIEIVELRVRTNQLKYLRHELKKREKIFSTSDWLYFTYFLQVRLKKEGKGLIDRTCIYYVVIIILSRKSLLIPIDKLAAEIQMGTRDFTKKLAEKSGIDWEKEELLGVENMIKVADLERKVRVLKGELKENKKIIEDKDKKLEEKDNEIERLKAQLKDK